MAKPNCIELGSGKSAIQIPILYEDRSSLAIDKPAGWMLAPSSWQQTSRNLQAAIESSIAAGDFWARSRNLKFLRFVHRLDAETSGVLLFAKSPGAVKAYSGLFEKRETEKVYLAVVHGVPKQTSWICRLRLAPVAEQPGKMKVSRTGKDAETHFRVLRTKVVNFGEPLALIEARPMTGRTHQIRVHSAEAGHAVVGDSLYGGIASGTLRGFALRAVELRYTDPFSDRNVRICAPRDDFLRAFGFNAESK